MADDVTIFNVARDDSGRWGVYLDHQCDEWDIAGETSVGATTGIAHEKATARLEAFLADGQRALAALRAGRPYGWEATREPAE